MVGSYGFTCQSCRETLDTPFVGSDPAHKYAQEQGWRYTQGPGGGFDGGWGANITCERCSAGDSYAVDLWVSPNAR